MRNFRHGLYYGDIDFHIGDVSDWTAAQIASRQGSTSQKSVTSDASTEVRPTPFLAHALLDLPSADTHLSSVASVLHPNGVLTVFNPSITQIVQCVERVKAENLPLVLERVVELETGRSGGRIWDVKAVRVRGMESRTKKEDAGEIDGASETKEGGSESRDSESELPEFAGQDDEQALDPRKRDAEYVMVCRPKVGEMVVGGGFLGIWRKMNH